MKTLLLKRWQGFFLFVGLFFYGAQAPYNAKSQDGCFSSAWALRLASDAALSMTVGDVDKPIWKSLLWG
jgi:hypothetical protein